MERGTNRLKRNRAVATHYDQLDVRYEATLHIAAINGRLRPGFLRALSRWERQVTRRWRDWPDMPGHMRCPRRDASRRATTGGGVVRAGSRDVSYSAAHHATPGTEG
jgi:hypothetical protein